MARAQPFGPYLLHERLNVGGMAEVWRASVQKTGEALAIKRLLPSLAQDEDFVGMFHDEAAIASKLQHPNIVRIHDIGAEGKHLYIAMELVEGKDCRTLLDRAEAAATRVPIHIVLGLVVQAARGLGYAHARVDAQGKPLGVVHRDVSLQNLILRNDGVLKIIDFGIAKAEGNLARTAVGTIKGKFGYMAPEQVVGDPVDARTDVFALGIVAWELLTGERLFLAANDVATIEKVRRCEISRPSTRASVPPEIDEIVMKALAKRPSDRYVSASSLLADLEDYARKGGDIADAPALANHLRATFGAAPSVDASGTRSREEKMSEEKKGGSDLDVFEGLQKKAGQRPSLPPSTSPPMPPGPPQRPRAKTMIGVAPPPVAPPGGAIPNPRGTMPMPLPPPSRAPASAPLPPPTSRSVPPGPPPSSLARQTMPIPVVPPPGSRPPGGLPAPLPPPGQRSAPPPVPPPNKTGPGPVSASQKSAADMDWDDEDEKTNIYDKNDTKDQLASLSKPLPAAGAPSRKLGGAAALAGASGGVAAPPPVPGPASLPRPGMPGAGLPPPGALPPPSAPAMPTSAPMPSRNSGRAEPTQVVKPAESGGSGKGLILGVVAFLLLAGAAAAYFILQPKTGSLIVQVKSGGRDLSSVEVSVDDKKVCDAAPCNVKELGKGTHTVKAMAPGYEPGTEIVVVRAGEETAAKIELAKGKDAAPDQPSNAAKGTGFKVAGPAHVKLTIDGKEIGPLPQEVKDLAPGEHAIKLSSSDRYKVDERKLTVAENEIKDLGTVKLPVLKGKAKLNLQTPGAFVKLQSGSETRMVSKFPIELEIDPAKTWTIVATKPGFIDYRQEIKFDDEAEKTFEIALMKKGEKKDDDGKKDDGKKDDGKKDDGKKDEGGNGTLSINSIPPSNCILDGRPLGMTPKAGVSVSAGTHTVVFVHPEHGRKSTSVTVKAGESKSVGVKF